MFIPADSQSGSEVYVTKASMDWGAEELLAQVASGDFIDAGAHIGYYSLYLSPLVRRAYAFEPDPRCFDALAVNAAVGGNIEHIRKALSDRCGQAKLDVSGSAALSSISERGTLAVETTTIDAFVATLADPQIGAIKTDVEGHDLAVLRGAAETLKAHQPVVLSELQPHEVAAFAESIRYDVRARLIDGRAKMTFLVPRRLRDAFSCRADRAGFSRR